MDRVIYTAMTAATHTMTQLAAVSHNLANADTTGFRADFNTFMAVPVYGEGNPTRVQVVNSTAGSSFAQGSVMQTGRDLDIAVEGQGWIAVQNPDGSEAYTRNGSLKFNSNGVLQTRSGLNVMGEAGPITIPPNTDVTIGKDGTVSTVPTNGLVNAVQIVGRIKLVNPPENQMVKGADNLFRLRNGQPASSDANVLVGAGSLEGSNVNVVESMISMIDLGRSFDMQMKLLQTADTNARQASTLMNITA